MNEQSESDDFLAFLDELHEAHVARIEAQRKLLAERVTEVVLAEFDWEPTSRSSVGAWLHNWRGTL